MMADVSPRTDTSTDASTEDKNSRFQSNQGLAVVASDGSDKSRDQKTLRRLAQNREAARKSRLRKKDLMTKRIIGKGHESGGLYILDTQVPKSIACSSILTPFEAHCRLGHPSLPLLKKLCHQFQNVSSLDCESC